MRSVLVSLVYEHETAANMAVDAGIPGSGRVPPLGIELRAVFASDRQIRLGSSEWCSSGPVIRYQYPTDAPAAFH